MQSTPGSGNTAPFLPNLAFTALVPLPALKTLCGLGFGVAACPALGLLVTSDDKKNTLSVWDLGGGASVGGASGGAGASAGTGVGGASAGGSGGDGGLRLVCTLGGSQHCQVGGPHAVSVLGWPR